MAVVLRLALGMLGTMAATAACAEPSSAALFQAYPAEPAYDGPAAPPDLSPPDVHAYRTRVREAAALPANFNGHERLITWGCGTSCFMGAVFDRANGRVVLFPFFICCGAALSADDPDPILFQATSSLVVFRGLRNGEPPDGDHYYRFANDAFTFLKTVPIAAAADASARAGAPAAPAAPKAAAAPPAKQASAKTCRTIADARERLTCFDKAFQVAAAKPERPGERAPNAPAPSAPAPAALATPTLAAPSFALPLRAPDPSDAAPDASAAPPIDDPSVVDAYKKQITPLLQSMSLARIAMSCGQRSDEYYKFFLVAFDQKRQSLIKQLHMRPGIIPGMAEEVKRIDEVVVKAHPCASLAQGKDLKTLDKLKKSLAAAPR